MGTSKSPWEAEFNSLQSIFELALVGITREEECPGKEKHLVLLTAWGVVVQERSVSLVWDLAEVDHSAAGINTWWAGRGREAQTQLK